MENEDFTIMAFSWNADGLKLCESLSVQKIEDARKGFMAKLRNKKDCIIPDFFNDIKSMIVAKKPSLVVFTTQDEDVSDTYFHAKLLSNALPEIGYNLLKRNKKEKIGERASGLKHTDVQTGQPNGSALRISIYAKHEITNSLRVEEKQMRKFFKNDGQAEFICGTEFLKAGAIVSYVWHKVYGKFAFIAMHLPDSGDLIKVGKNNYTYDTYRLKNKATTTLCTIRMLEKFVLNVPVEAQPNHIFLLGDMNSNISVPNKNSTEIIKDLTSNYNAMKIKELSQYDDLKQIMVQGEALYGFKEGIGGEGPLFMPTWHLAKGRSSKCSPDQNTTSLSYECFDNENENVPNIGWRDRILYKDLLTNNYIINCKEYNRFDISNMNFSSHAGVIGFYSMQQT